MVVLMTLLRLTALAALLFQLGGAQAPAASAGLQAEKVAVRIIAERFEFRPASITVPLGARIEFTLVSEDTLHGFRIIGGDVDVEIPKRGRGKTVVSFTPTAAGEFTFECSRVCGAGHGFMRGTVKVTPKKVTP